MKKTLSLYSLLAFCSFLIFSCGTHVTRVSEDTVTDLSGRWNETDSRLTAEEITQEMMSHPWYNTYTSKNAGEQAVLIVGMITNKSHEHIATETFSKDIEKAIINSSRLRLVQAGAMREEVRAERADQQNYSSSSSMKRFGLEQGADFMLQGTVNSIVDQYKKDKSIYYQIDLELTNLETNEKVWIGDKKIKKMLR